jgi:hypothetical protein
MGNVATPSAKDKPSQHALAAAAAFIKAKAARGAVEAAAKTLENDKAALAELQSRRSKLPHDEAAIRKFRSDKEIAEIKIEIAEAQLAAAQSALADADAEHKRVVAESAAALAKSAQMDAERVDAEARLADAQAALAAAEAKCKRVAAEPAVALAREEREAPRTARAEVDEAKAKIDCARRTADAAEAAQRAAQAKLTAIEDAKRKWSGTDAEDFARLLEQGWAAAREANSANSAALRAAEALASAEADHSRACKSLEWESLRQRRDEVIDRIFREYPAAAQAIVAVVASYRRLAVMVAKANKRRGALALREPSIMLREQFLEHLRVPVFDANGGMTYAWYPASGVEKLDQIEPCRVVSLDGMKLNAPLDDEAKFDEAARQVKEVEARLVARYESLAKDIVRLMRIGWEVRRDMDAFRLDSWRGSTKFPHADRCLMLAGMVGLPAPFTPRDPIWYPHWSPGHLETMA